MGVHGLTGHLRRIGLIDDGQIKTENVNTIDANGDGGGGSIVVLPPGIAKLAIDGNGLLYHLHRLAYHRHRRAVRPPPPSQSSMAENDCYPSSTSSSLSSSLRGHGEWMLLPYFVPLDLLHDVATRYLSDLTYRHGMDVTIYFDGAAVGNEGRDGMVNDMKRREIDIRVEKKEGSWDNVRRFCQHGTLPTNDVGGRGTPSKFRSSARKQARDRSRREEEGGDDGGGGGGGVGTGGGIHDDDDDGVAAMPPTTNTTTTTPTREEREANEAELYLMSFPSSPLAFHQIEMSINAYAEIISGSGMLPRGNVRVMYCDDGQEADVRVALASASDVTGMTYALGEDSDYLIYGCDSSGTAAVDGGEVRYVRFGQIDPSSSSLRVVGRVLTRSDVAYAIGLPRPDAMIELSILMGNDYTGPFLVREDNVRRRRKYWDSIRWVRKDVNDDVNNDDDDDDDDDKGRLPSEDELNRWDVRGVAHHVAMMVGDGYRLTSDDVNLRMAIEYSYELYSFGDVTEIASESNNANDDDDGDAKDDTGVICVFPHLPNELDLSPLRRGEDPIADADLCDAALAPLITYMTENADFNDVGYVERRHLDAFRMTLDSVRNDNGRRGGMMERLNWDDMRALYVLERCLVAAIECAASMPYQVFSHSIFHSSLEGISFDLDRQINEELVSEVGKLMLDGSTGALPDGGTDGRIDGTIINPMLPIDEHKEDILNTVKSQRVTIIHGETGCGKSSRVPCFLLRADPPEPTSTAPEVKMIVSQPRRIAAKALAERVRSCEPDIADKIGLRMGHGIREHETSRTRAWFVTTGYVVRLLANHPNWFDSHTHLIIDEVHERSIDTDILCLLCRRLLTSHPTIRLVLMSATMAAELYSQYFGSPQPPIHVGARRFQIQEYFVEDLSNLLSLSSKTTKMAVDVYNECEKSKCLSAPSANCMEKLHFLAAQITSSVGGHGSSVLIFVPGMSDIESIIELIEKLDIPGSSFICLPIHSDVPFEDQMAAFEPPKEGEVKVIIATNAAESSLTLPDVDHVICLGLCKQIVYNRATHRQMLCPTWISRASATQRAGRTGRVRQGTVYRLYTRNAFYHYMPLFEQGELARSPLDNTILSLRDMLNEAVTPILLDCLEPPDISTIERSFQSLHSSNFISCPTDDGVITSLGSLVVALGIDLTLGALVGVGIQFGVAPEAIQLAAILSFPKTPWAVSSPMYHDTEIFNEIVSKSFVSKCFFDNGLFSEPMAISNLLHAYSICKDKKQFCWKHRVVASRMSHLHGTIESLKRRVAERLGVSLEALEMKSPPNLMNKAKINVLRILQCWMFYDTMIVQSPSKNTIKSIKGGVSIKLDGPPINRGHLAQILDEDRHKYELLSEGKSSMQGNFQTVFADSEERALYLSSFEIRLVSLMLENKIELSFYTIGNNFTIFVQSDTWKKPGSKLRDIIIQNIAVRIAEVSYLQNSISGNQRGRRGRACGLWHPSTADELIAWNGSSSFKRVVRLSGLVKKKEIKGFKQIMDKEISTMIDSSFKVGITEEKKKISFRSTSSGQCPQISHIDLCDLFAAPDLVAHAGESTSRQVINFPCLDSEARRDTPRHFRPLIQDAPEGARLMSVLASERRRTTFIRFSDGDSDHYTDVNLPKNFSINGSRWKRKSGGMVFVQENCVPAAVIPTDDNVELFGCCANTLELRGGAARVEGISLLPQGRLFVGLALLAFGVNPKTGDLLDVSEIDDYIEEEKKDPGSGLQLSSIVDDVWRWVKERDKFSLDQTDRWRIIQALHFHAGCMRLGETLKCQPDKIRALCALFDGVDGTTMTVWDLDTALSSLSPKKSQKRNSIVNDRQRLPSSMDDDTCIEAGNVNWRTTDKRSKGRRSKKDGSGHGIDTYDDAAEFIASSIASSYTTVATTDAYKGVVESISGNVSAQEIGTVQGIAKAAPKQKNPIPSTPSDFTKTKIMFACVECDKVFKKWTTCIRHRDECHPGLKLNQNRSIAHAGALVSASDHPSAELSSNEMKGGQQQSEVDGKKEKTKTKTNAEGCKNSDMFACVECDQVFKEWNACIKHRDELHPGLKLNQMRSVVHAGALAKASIDKMKGGRQPSNADGKKKHSKNTNKAKGRKNDANDHTVDSDMDVAEFIATVITGW